MIAQPRESWRTADFEAWCERRRGREVLRAERHTERIPPTSLDESLRDVVADLRRLRDRLRNSDLLVVREPKSTHKRAVEGVAREFEGVVDDREERRDRAPPRVALDAWGQELPRLGEV